MNNKLRLIQCGVGGFGKGWVENHTSKSPDFELVALVDLADKQLEEAGELTGVPAERRFKMLEAALDAVEADAVLSVTPPPVHVIHARAAFARGLHVMTEKPCADTIENAREMVALAKRAGKQLSVSQNYRFRPMTQKLKQLLAEGVVGEFGGGHLDFYIPADFTGTFRETMEFPLLIDMSIHHFDLIRSITGRNIERITAQSFNPPWSWYQNDCGLKMLMELEGGIPFSYSGDWSAKGRVTSWNGEWRLQCALGSIHLTNDQVSVARCETWNRNVVEEPVDAPVLEWDSQAATLHQFAESIRSGIPAETSGVDNLYSFGSVIAARTSILEKRTVEVREIIGD